VVHTNLNDDSVTEFRSSLYAELDQPNTLIMLNLEKVRSINSAALGAILLLQKKAREKGIRICISKCNEELRKTLLAIRLDRIVEMPGEAPPTMQR
jgi:anti-anti-sigma factor